MAKKGSKLPPRPMHLGSKLSAVRRLATKLGGIDQLRQLLLLAEMENDWLLHQRYPTIYNEVPAKSLLEHVTRTAEKGPDGQFVVRSLDDLLAVVQILGYLAFSKGDV